MFGYKDHRQTLNKFKQMLLDKFGNNLISLVVFGSIARGTAMKESDIDLLIILKEASDVYYKRLEPVIDIELKLREEGAVPVFSCIVLSMEETKENRNIFLDMIDDSIILHDRDDFFKKRLKDMKNRLLQLGSKKVVLDDRTWYWNLKPDIRPGEAIEL